MDQHFSSVDSVMSSAGVLRTLRARLIDDLWPPWLNGWTITTSFIVLTLLVGLVIKPSPLPHYHVAFIGNSMQYYNDLPRFMETLSKNRISQDSCLHGDATLTNILRTGSGMYGKFDTTAARIDYVDNANNATVYDYGACTVPQLLFGRDESLDLEIQQLQAVDNESEERAQTRDLDDVYSYLTNDDGSSFYLVDDGSNPCFHDFEYFQFLEWRRQQSAPPSLNFIVLNDNTRSPARTQGREAGLQILEQVYIPWFLKTNATPIFLHTHAYWADWRDLSALLDVPTFTSYTYAGYRAYVELVNSYLSSPQQKARIAPAGMAYLIIWEENYYMWEKLFHIDRVHASPHGTYLEGCILHATIFGKLPDPAVALQDNLQNLWSRARRMQPPGLPANPIPTPDEAAYLYHICQRVMTFHQRPRSFFTTTASANYTPEDWLYSANNSLGR
jgi:hypothetical protein